MRREKERVLGLICEKVKCSLVHTKMNCDGWPYPSISSTSSLSSRPDIYCHMASKSTMPPMSSPALRAPSFSRPDSYDMNAFDPQRILPRQSFNIEQSVNYEADPTVAYYTNSPPYMSPGAASGVFIDDFGPPWNPRAWNQTLPLDKLPTGVYTDLDMRCRLMQPSYFYGVSTHGPTPSDIPPFFSASTSVSSDGQGTDRTLPSPAVQNQVQSCPSIFSTIPEAMPSFNFSQNFKVESGWDAKSSTTIGDSYTTMPITSTGTFTSSPVNRTRPSPSNTQESVFDFLPMPSNSVSPHSMASSATFTELDSIDSPGDFLTGTDTRYTRSTKLFPRDNGLADYSPIYSHSNGGNRKNRRDQAGDSVPTLITGFPYTPVRNTAPNVSAFNPLQSDPPMQYGEQIEEHRTPVTALRNVGC